MIFTEPYVLALSGCTPAEPVPFLKGKSNIAIFQALIDPSFEVIDPFAVGNNPEGRALLSM
jgi:hypothetical protein